MSSDQAPLRLNVSDFSVDPRYLELATKCVRIYQTYACAISAADQEEFIEAMRQNLYIAASEQGQSSAANNTFLKAMRTPERPQRFIREKVTFIRWMLIVATTGTERSLYWIAFALQSMGLREQPACFAEYRRHHATDLQQLVLPKITKLAAPCPRSLHWMALRCIPNKTLITPQPNPHWSGNRPVDDNGDNAGGVIQMVAKRVSNNHSPVRYDQIPKSTVRTETSDGQQSLGHIKSDLIDLCDSSDDENEPKPPENPSTQHHRNTSTAGKDRQLPESDTVDTTACSQALATAATALSSVSQTLAAVAVDKSAASLEECRARIRDLEAENHAARGKVQELQDMCLALSAELATTKNTVQDTGDSLDSRLVEFKALVIKTTEHSDKYLKRYVDDSIKRSAKKQKIDAREDVDRYLKEAVTEAVGEFIENMGMALQQKKKKKKKVQTGSTG